jgi:IS5 family transposase
MMAPQENAPEHNRALAQRELAGMVDQGHALVKLADQIDWQAARVKLGALYAPGHGRPPLPIRLMIGLHYLKHLFNLSDEDVVLRWAENPYWQYFCGERYFQYRLPIDPSQMTRFRKRVGAAGCEVMLKLTIDAGLLTRTITPASLEAVNVDTTVQEKAIAHPTDARLYPKTRVALVRAARQSGLRLRQSYDRLGKKALAMNGRYAHARQMRRARREQKRLRTYLGRVMRDIERKMRLLPMAGTRLTHLLEIAHRIHAQQRHDKHKVYSVHAPEVECLAKGKAHKQYEFGVKVSVASTNRDNFVVGMQAMPGNPYDGHTLQTAVEQTTALTGTVPKQVFVDRGYRGHRFHQLKVWIAGARRGVTALIGKRLRRRNAI